MEKFLGLAKKKKFAVFNFESPAKISVCEIAFNYEMFLKRSKKCQIWYQCHNLKTNVGEGVPPKTRRYNLCIKYGFDLFLVVIFYTDDTQYTKHDRHCQGSDISSPHAG